MGLDRSRVTRDLFLLWTLTGACVRGAEAPPERVRLLCDESDPVNICPGGGFCPCPGPDCFCVEDTLEVTFDGDTGSVLEYAAFEAGTEFRATIVTETTGPERQSWSFGVAHDASALELLEVGIQGTDAERAFAGAFDSTSMDHIETCDTSPACKNRTPGGGWISAFPFCDWSRCELPVKRNTVAWARYRLLRDVGEDGTLIPITDRLAKAKSPPVDVNLTVAGKSRRWGMAVDGWVKKEGGGPWGLFRRGDVGIQGPAGTSPADGEWNITDALRILLVLFDTGYAFACEDAADVNDDGELNLTDAIYSLTYLFVGGPPPPIPFPECGMDPVIDALDCQTYPGCQ